MWCVLFVWVSQKLFGVFRKTSFMRDFRIGGLAFKIKFSDGLKDEFEDPVLTPTGDGSIMNSVKIPVIAKIANILYTQSTQLHSALFLQ